MEDHDTADDCEMSVCMSAMDVASKLSNKRNPLHRGLDVLMDRSGKYKEKFASAQRPSGIHLPGISSLMILREVPVELCVIWSGCARNYEAITEEDVSDISGSIRKFGILNPLIGRRNSQGHIEVISGARRIFCAKELGLSRVPILLGDVTDSEALTLAIVLNNHKRLDSKDRLRFLDRMGNDLEDPFRDGELLASHF